MIEDVDSNFSIPIDSYILESGIIVLGKKIDTNHILYAKGNSPYQAEVYIKNIIGKSTATPLEGRVIYSLPGIYHFPNIEERTLGILEDLSTNSGTLEAYTLLHRKALYLKISQIVKIDGEIEKIRNIHSILSLDNDIAKNHYFFQSQNFVKEYQKIIDTFDSIL